MADGVLWFRCFVRCLLFQTLRDVDLMLDRERSGRQAGPTAGRVDSQMVKAPAAQAVAVTMPPRR
ncbi:hypothetical protein MAE02_20990 [Microvirga aerophila]|uniref:Uncharacterized protein n=1 Tax=Microvirga aerophila TaxID=670291 RepID=A0A512BQV7_9HYPH|nr:hypothetical protein MAE02_20990 [Microvirga aerophila]